MLQISRVFDALEIDSLTSFLWFGTRHSFPIESTDQTLTEEQMKSFLSLHLKAHLYRKFYCTGGASHHTVAWDYETGCLDSGKLVSRLSDANAGKGFWDPGWQIVAAEPSLIGCRKGGLTIYAPPENCRVDEGGTPSVGETVSLWHGKHSFNRSPGFYTVYGDESLRGAVADEILRLYWNIDLAGAAGLIKAVTGRLNDARMPFNMKILDEPGRYGRCDSAILYVAKESYEEFRREHARSILQTVGCHLGDRVPALTKEVAHGVGVAENPRRHESFGTSRCGALAEVALSRPPRLAACSADDLLAAVRDHFQRAGIDPEKPHRNAGSSEDYGPVRRGAGVALHAVANRTGPAPSEERCLAAACEIAALIVEKAVWHGCQCSWLGALGPLTGAAGGLRFGSLGADLYDGTSGIAWFLGQLFVVTGDESMRQTALGAIRHALARGRDDAGRRSGLYVGVLGIAVVAARLAKLLQQENLLLESRRLAATPHSVEDHEFDLMAGSGGKVLAYIMLGELIGEGSWLEVACAAGEQLVASAQRSASGASWRSPHMTAARGLTGFSHGAAGAGYALLELFALTGHQEFRSVAEAAFDYERCWFDAREGNWPDFRQLAEGTDPRSVRLPYSNTWCHGAAGIAISRLRAAEILPDRAYLEEARVALKTTHDHLQAWVRSGRANYSLCHGVAGNADILLTAVRSGLQLGFDAGASIGETAAGLQVYGADHSRWPCGVGGGGANPSLMLGWAGIGYFFLRLARRDVPSPLVPGAERRCPGRTATA